MASEGWAAGEPFSSSSVHRCSLDKARIIFYIYNLYLNIFHFPLTLLFVHFSHFFTWLATRLQESDYLSCEQ